MGNAMDFPDLAGRVCDAFRQQVGKQARMHVLPATDENPQPTLVFCPKGGKAERIYATVPVPVPDAATFGRLIRDWKRNTRKIVITPHATIDIANRFKAEKIPFLDAAGNA